jgi:hypothetical protein
MLMGEHVPLCLLGGWGIAWLTRKMRRVPRGILLAVVVIATFPSNAFFIRRDLIHLKHNVSETNQIPVVAPTELAAFDFIDKNTPRDAGILAFPTEAAYIPGFIGHPVWSGHWGETPDFSRKYSQFAEFTNPLTPDSRRIQFLRSTNTQYFLYPKDIEKARDPLIKSSDMFDFHRHTPYYLKCIFENEQYAVYQITLPEAGA